MIKILHVTEPTPEIIRHAISGMRNPMNSWSRIDSFIQCDPLGDASLKLGPNDTKLMSNLIEAGPEHRKILRMLPVLIDIEAPLYWWKEFDTYKVGTVANSCSTMHKIADKKFYLEDFSVENLNADSVWIMNKVINELNTWREAYLDTKDTNPELAKSYWWQMIQLLPSSYNQKRTIMLNYEVLRTIYKQRKNHKLDEWNVFCDFIETLQFGDLIS